MKKDKKPIKESIIGKIIYGFLMFSPLLTILVTSLYAIINPNAKDSYDGYVYIDKSVAVSDTGNLLEGLNYNFVLDLSKGIQNQNTITYKYSEISIDWSNYGAPSTNTYNGFMIQKTTTSFFLLLRENDTTVYTFWDGLSTFGRNFTFVLKPSIDLTQNGNQPLQVYYNTFVEENLDNVFYYSLDKVENSSYFGWSKNTAIYSVLNTTCNELGITTTFVPMILTYWLIISVIYLIYDLVLVFIHIAHKKVHELEEF